MGTEQPLFKGRLDGPACNVAVYQSAAWWLLYQAHSNGRPGFSELIPPDGD
jgi:hypothetical protein